MAHTALIYLVVIAVAALLLVQLGHAIDYDIARYYSGPTQGGAQ